MRSCGIASNDNVPDSYGFDDCFKWHLDQYQKDIEEIILQNVWGF